MLNRLCVMRLILITQTHKQPNQAYRRQTNLALSAAVLQSYDTKDITTVLK